MYFFVKYLSAFIVNFTPPPKPPPPKKKHTHKQTKQNKKNKTTTNKHTQWRSVGEASLGFRYSPVLSIFAGVDLIYLFNSDWGLILYNVINYSENDNQDSPSVSKEILII